MKSLVKANETLEIFHKLVHSNTPSKFPKIKGYKVGVDLGTSSIVLVVLNEKDQPIYGAFEYANVIRDGLVVDYQRAVAIVNHLREEAEQTLGFSLAYGSVAVPPGTMGNNKKVVSNVIEDAGIHADRIVDESSAAALLLDVEKGAVIDVGGGTTGISLLANYNPIIVNDEPTGGIHMTLVIAGHYNISVEEAERVKRDPQKETENFAICRPVIHKMGAIVAEILEEHPTEPIYVVGGASYFSGFEQEFSNYVGQPVYKPLFPQYVTPLGIAMASKINCFE